MDTLTHALSGALIARATAPRHRNSSALPPGRRILIGFLAAAFPDLDALVSWVSPVAYLSYHRGVTHSLLMLPLWAFALAWLCWLVWRTGPRWNAYFGVIAWGIGIHIAGDCITSFGTMIFAPLSDIRYALSATFIIDLYFTGIILIGLLLSAAWRSSRVPAVSGLGALAAYVTFQLTLQQYAVDFGKTHARTAGLGGAEVSAIPRPVSPFNWMVIVRDGDYFEYSLVNVAGREPDPVTPDSGLMTRLAASYEPFAKATWVRVERYGVAASHARLAKEAWQQPQFRFFRWFARYPVLYRLDGDDASACAWFQDLRFLTPGRRSWPFRFGMCRDEKSGWKAFRLLDGDRRLPIS